MKIVIAIGVFCILAAVRDENADITGPNAGGARQYPIRTLLAARVGQFQR